MRNRLSSMVLAICVLAIPACEASCSFGGQGTKRIKELPKEISAKLSKVAGIDIQVTCPTIEPDKVTECSARAATGETFAVEVKKDDDGDLAWGTRGVAIGPVVAEQIMKVFQSKAKLDIERVDCPVIMPLQQGSAECKGHKQGVDVAFEVKFHSEGVEDVKYRSGVVVSASAAKLAEDTLAQHGIPVKVDCGPATLRVSVPDATFTCTAMAQSGQSQPIYYKILDSDGQVRMQTEPFE